MRRAVGRTVVQRCRGERGAAMVEFALILPLLVLLTFGIIEFAIAFNADSNINQAGRAGGRTAAILSTDPQMAFKAGRGRGHVARPQPRHRSPARRSCASRKFNPANPTAASTTRPRRSMTLVHPGTPGSPVWAIQTTVATRPAVVPRRTDNWPVSAAQLRLPGQRPARHASTR